MHDASLVGHVGRAVCSHVGTSLVAHWRSTFPRVNSGHGALRVALLPLKCFSPIANSPVRVPAVRSVSAASGRVGNQDRHQYSCRRLSFHQSICQL